MKISKHYDTTLSHKFPNGDIATIRLGTAIEVDTVLDTAPASEIAKFSAKLSKRTYRLTMKDVKKVCAEDKLADEVYNGLQNAIKSSENEREAERILYEDDDE